MIHSLEVLTYEGRSEELNMYSMAEKLLPRGLNSKLQIFEGKGE